MEAKDCIKGRRSIRKYSDKGIGKAELEELISLSSFAPSWKNSQTARYIAVLDSDTKEKLINEGLSCFPHNQDIARSAPAIIVLTSVEKRAGYERDGSFTTSKGTHWESFDAGIAAQTLCLAAHSMGLGTVIMGIFEEDKVKAAVGVPEGQTVAAVIALGYPAEEPSAPKRKDVSELLTYR